MDVLLRDGDLVLDSAGSPRYVEGNAELLQRVLLRLTARRGGFAPCPELGSRLYQLSSAGERELRAAVEEALYPVREVSVLGVERAPGPERDQLRITVRLGRNEQPITAVLQL